MSVAPEGLQQASLVANSCVAVKASVDTNFLFKKKPRIICGCEGVKRGDNSHNFFYLKKIGSATQGVNAPKMNEWTMIMLAKVKKNCCTLTKVKKNCCTSLGGAFASPHETQCRKT